MPAGRVPEYVPNGINALLPEHLYEAGDARLFYLFEGLEVRGGVSFVVEPPIFLLCLGQR